MSGRVDHERVAAATLVHLPAMTPHRLRRLLDHFGGPRAALLAVGEGRAGEALRPGEGSRARATAWAGQLATERVARLLARRGTRVLLGGSSDDPVVRPVPDPPAVLLAEGARPEVLERPRVAVVGTRAATPSGLADAHELGRFLATVGVTVVSGLAIGIDGAAHDGALRAGQADGGGEAGSSAGGVVGVVATGLDVVYPRRHAALTARVRDGGLVLTEAAFGTPPEPHRFPVRNRIIAALADVVVVVEATARGGARITADHALRYGRPVLAVPGSRRNPAAAGTNALIADGAHPLLDPSDVLVALDLVGVARAGWGPPPPEVGPVAAATEQALGGEPATLDELAVRTGRSPAEVAAAVRELERAGRVDRRRGLCWPR